MIHILKNVFISLLKTVKYNLETIQNSEWHLLPQQTLVYYEMNYLLPIAISVIVALVYKLIMTQNPKLKQSLKNNANHKLHQWPIVPNPN